MTKNRRQTGKPGPGGLPHHRQLLDGTDWASLATACGTGESLPSALSRLLDPDPPVRADAAKHALGAVTHQNTLYEATAPVALYAAAILHLPHVTAGDFDPGPDSATPSHRPTLVRLLDWLRDTARDADDECVALGVLHYGERFLHDYTEMRAFRDLRPAIFSAVQPLLDHESANARDAALAAAIPLAEHPLLAEHRGELVHHARRLLMTSSDRSDRHNRDRVLDALRAWGHDTSELENAADRAARARYARLMAERAGWGGDRTGGYSEDPPF
ncbi:hypothetical protein [Streptomyces sp. NPDC054849]